MDWTELKKEYIASKISYRKLAEKHGVSFSNLKNVAIKEQWTKLREQAKNRTDTKLVENIGKQNAKIEDKYYKLVDKLLDKTEEVIEGMPVWQVASLKEMAMTLKYLKECKGVKSDIDLREQEARIAKLNKDATVDDNGSTEVAITFGVDEEQNKWAE